MGKVIASASLSLSGFVAHPDDSPGHLFDWHSSGDVVVPTTMANPTFARAVPAGRPDHHHSGASG